jgi:hypothetical protein
MPLQNRVDPFGQIIVTAERGAWMGNRGLLHDEQKRVRRPWRLKAWLTCRLEFRARRREVMSPGHYTELFFMDEATAFAAGHRPCCECRRTDYNRFKAAAEAGLGQTLPMARDMDDMLHADRIDAQGGKRTWYASLTDVPDGAMVRVNDAPWLKWRGALHRWTPGGYAGLRTLDLGKAEVLTPPLTVAALTAGYVPQVRLD